MEDNSNKLLYELRETILHSYPYELTERNMFLHICEMRGIPTITNVISKKIASYCQKLVNNGSLGEPKVESATIKEYHIHLPKDFLYDVYDSFIFDLDCQIQLVLFSQKDVYYKTLKNKNCGAYDYETHSNKLIGNGLHQKLDTAKIQVRCFALKDEVYHSVYYTIIHELNHCYEDYMRLLKGEETFEDWVKKTKYKENVQLMAKTDNEYIASLTFIIYNLNPTEINAKVSQMYGELSHKFYQNSIFASEEIKQTNAYKSISLCYNYLNKLKNNTIDEYKSEIINTFNKCSNKRINDYEYLMEYLEKELNTVKKIIFMKAAKNIDRINQESFAD